MGQQTRHGLKSHFAVSGGYKVTRPVKTQDAEPRARCWIKNSIGCHTFGATGMTDYLTNGGKLEIAQHMAGIPTQGLGGKIHVPREQSVAANSRVTAEQDLS